MRSKKEVEPIIRKIYTNKVKSKLGRIDHVSKTDCDYRVIIEDATKIRMVAEVQRKDIDNYFIEHKRQSAIKNIVKALNNFEPVDV